MNNAFYENQLFDIMLDMDYEQILDIKNTNPRAKNIINSTIFWQNKGLKDFGIKTCTEKDYLKLIPNYKIKSFTLGFSFPYLQSIGIPKTPNKSIL